jgi:hypothetical protein
MRRLILLLLFLPTVCIGQIETTEEQPTFEWLNSPIYFPESDFVIGLNNYAFADMPFAISKVLTKRDDDSLVFSVPQLFSELDESVNFFVNSRSQFFYLGMKIGSKKRNYLTLSNDLVTYFDLDFNKDFLDYLINGNHNYLGQEVIQDRKGMGFTAYNSMSLSFARQMNKKLIVELRAKYLTGLVNVQLERFNINLFSNHPINGEALFTEVGYDILAHTSSIHKNSSNDYKKNKGYAFDLGMRYTLNEQTDFLLSVNEIGFIDWDISNNETYALDSTFSVESLFDPLDQSSDIGEQVQDNLDSISDVFFIDTLYSAYRTTLPMQINIGARFQINEKQNCSLLINSIKQGSEYYNSINMAYELSVASFLKTQITYQIIDKSYDNLGIGLLFSLGRFEVDLNSSNIFAVDLLNSEKSAYRFGLRYKFNRKEKLIDRKYSDYKNRF